MKIELIYFNGCPNVDPARKNLKEAFEATGIKSNWDEWEHGNPEAPDYVLEYGSPTILIDGKDVARGPEGDLSPNSCRLYEGGGAPSVKMIKAAIGIR